MRSIIDKNNLNNSEETLIYYSRINIIWRAFILIVLTIVIIYSLQDKEFIPVLVGTAIFLFQIYYLVKSIKRINEIQFRINAEGIQYKNLIPVSWHNIENERVVTEYTSDENNINYFTYNVIDSEKIMRFNIKKFNINKWELQKALTIHRDRFNKENNLT